MSILIALIVIVVLACLGYWLISSAPIPGPMAPVIKWALYAILSIVLVLYLLRYLPGIRLP